MHFYLEYSINVLPNPVFFLRDTKWIAGGGGGQMEFMPTPRFGPNGASEWISWQKLKNTLHNWLRNPFMYRAVANEFANTQKKLSELAKSITPTFPQTPMELVIPHNKH